MKQTAASLNFTLIILYQLIFLYSIFLHFASDYLNFLCILGENVVPVNTYYIFLYSYQKEECIFFQRSRGRQPILFIRKLFIKHFTKIKIINDLFSETVKKYQS